MLTRSLKFDDDVLAIIRSMDWHDDGRLGMLTCGQLDRKLYTRVNKALEAMGGKWNRSRSGHVFPIDPRLQVEGLIKNGLLTIEKDGFFETPPKVVRRMIELAQPTGNVLGPSAGLGAIVDHLPVSQSQVFCIEKNAQRAEVLRKKGYTIHCCDFLKYKAPGAFDTIFMNPPFEEGQDIDHIRHAYQCLAPGGTLVSVASEGPFFRNDRRATAFRDWAKQIKAYIERLPPRSFKESGTCVSTHLIVIHKAGCHSQP